MLISHLVSVAALACLSAAQTTEPKASSQMSTILHSTPSVVAGSIISYDPCKTELAFIMTCPASYECSAWNNITASCTHAPTSHRCTIPMREGNKTIGPTNIQPDTTVLIDCVYQSKSKATCSTSVLGFNIDKALSTTVLETLSAKPPAPTDIGGINSYHGVTIADGLQKMSANTETCSATSTGLAARATYVKEIREMLVPVGAAAMLGVMI